MSLRSFSSQNHNRRGLIWLRDPDPDGRPLNLLGGKKYPVVPRCGQHGTPFRKTCLERWINRHNQQSPIAISSGLVF